MLLHFMDEIQHSYCLICSKILLSKQKIIDLFPKIERTLESIKEADSTVMQMQIKRQREFWHLLKIACVSLMARYVYNIHIIMDFPSLYFSVYWGGR